MPNALTLENPTLENDSRDGWPSEVDMKVIDPGVVHYEDLVNSKGEHVGGNVLVSKATLDRIANSLKGKPIINWDHRSVNPKEYGKGKFQGIVTDVFYNSADGWYHARGYVWDEPTRKNINNGYSISCAYTVSEWGDGGTYHQVPYDKEVLNGQYTHIAVVPMPRYEGARIELLNSGGKTMGLLSLFRKDKTEEKIDIDMEKTMVPMGEGLGEKPLSELVNNWKALEAAKATTLSDSDFVEVDGKKITVLELKNASMAIYNEHEKKDMEEKHNSGGHSVRMQNCAMCNAAEEEEKKKKADDEAKNAADEAEKKKKDEEEKQNSIKAQEKKAKEDALANAAKLDELRNKGGEVKMPELKTLTALQAEGESRYGVKPVVK